MPLYVRPPEPEDEQFVYQLIYQQLHDELLAWLWDPAIRDHLLNLQVQAKHAAYGAMWPQAEYAIIMLDNDRVGRLIVNRVGEHYRLVDITVSPKHRGAGIGTRIVLALCMEAEMQQKSVRLYVSVTNPRAAALYRRLGFREIEKDETGCVMERSPGAVSQVIAAE